MTIIAETFPLGYRLRGCLYRKDSIEATKQVCVDRVHGLFYRSLDDWFMSLL